MASCPIKSSSLQRPCGREGGGLRYDPICEPLPLNDAARCALFLDLDGTTNRSQTQVSTIPVFPVCIVEA